MSNAKKYHCLYLYKIIFLSYVTWQSFKSLTLILFKISHTISFWFLIYNRYRSLLKDSNSLIKVFFSIFLYWGTLETHHFTFTVSSIWLIWGCLLYHFILLQNGPWFAMILICSCCSFWCNIDVSVFFFKNCRLTNVNLIRFENKHFKVVARCLNKWGKKQKFSKIIVLLHSYSQRFFANVSVKFSNINNKRMTSAHVATLLSFM